MRAEIEHRPWVTLAVGFIGGLVGRYHPFAIVLLGLLFAILSTSSSRILLGIAFGLGLVLAPPPVASILETRYAHGAMKIVATPDLYPDHTKVTLESERGELWRMRLDGQPMLAQGDVLAAEGRLRPLTEATERYLLPQGIVARFEPFRWHVVRPGFPLFRWAEATRRAFLGFSRRYLPPEAAGAVDALCFNVKTGLEAETRDELRRTGTIHIISASGLHVVVLAGALTALLSLLPIPRSAQFVVLAGLLALYTCAAGLQGPIVRAVFVVLVGRVAYLFRRDPDPLSALGVAAVAYLLVTPRDVANLGFQLSFLTVGAFCLYLPRADDPRPVLGWMRASLVATVASTPLVAYAFGQIPLLGIPANMAIALIVPAVVVVSLGAFGLASLVPSLAAGAMAFVRPLVDFLFGTVHFFAQPRWGVLAVPAFSAYLVVGMYALLLLLWRGRFAKSPR